MLIWYYIKGLTFCVIDVVIVSDSDEDPTATKPIDTTHINISAAGNLLVTNSGIDVQEVFKDSVTTLERHIMFTNAYPDANPQQKLPFLRETLTQSAKALAPKVFERLVRDPDYAKAIAESVSV